MGNIALHPAISKRDMERLRNAISHDPERVRLAREKWAKDRREHEEREAYKHQAMVELTEMLVELKKKELAAKLEHNRALERELLKEAKELHQIRLKKLHCELQAARRSKVLDEFRDLFQQPNNRILGRRDDMPRVKWHKTGVLVAGWLGFASVVAGTVLANRLVAP